MRLFFSVQFRSGVGSQRLHLFAVVAVVLALGFFGYLERQRRLAVAESLRRILLGVRFGVGAVFSRNGFSCDVLSIWDSHVVDRKLWHLGASLSGAKKGRSRIPVCLYAHIFESISLFRPAIFGLLLLRELAPEALCGHSQQSPEPP